MTAGQDALREAARLEAARVYGGIVPEYHNAPRTSWAAAAEAELAARVEQFAERLEAVGPPVDNPAGPVDSPPKPVGNADETPGTVVAAAEVDDMTRQVEDAIVAGCTNSQIITAYGVDYGHVRAARKRIVRRSAA